MFGLGWAEILVAAVVGLIVIGPKELPGVFRKIGQFVGKAKAMARDFSRAMNDAADDAGVKDAMDSVNSLKDGVRSVSDPTTKWKDFVPGSEIGKLSEERAEKAKKMHDAMAERAQQRLDAEKVTKAAASKEIQKPAAAKNLRQLRNLRQPRNQRLRKNRRRPRNLRLKRLLQNLVKIHEPRRRKPRRFFCPSDRTFDRAAHMPNPGCACLYRWSVRLFLRGGIYLEFPG